MRLQTQTNSGPFITEEYSLRTLPHAYGPIHVLDGLFSKEFVTNLGVNLASFPFTASDYDSEDTKNILHFKCELPAEELLGKPGEHPLNFPMLSIVACVTFELIRQFYTDYENIRPGRIHVNCIPHGDFLTNHIDGERDRSLTGLYFANVQWVSHWGGELILCDQHGESLYALDPKPGRVVLFPGAILHRGNAPSRLCFVNRLSIGHKFRAQRKEAGPV